jgi:hypothetical protein
MLTEEELEQDCELILKCSRIKKKIVVLCEGDCTIRTRRSPQSRRRESGISDADFYLACIPTNWREHKPIFFGCGDRHDTLASYFKLREMHERDRNNSYLSPDLLFALVDVDLQAATIDSEDYGFADTESIFHDLYQDLKLQPEKLPQHRIWVTGLTHKEAYFLNPDLQSIFNEYEQPIDYRDIPIELNLVYQEMVRDLSTDPDLKKHFDRAMSRICHCDRLEITTIDTLAQSWQQLWQDKNSIDPKLIFALLAIVKSKPYWQNVMQNSRQRESLSLEIARRFYSCPPDDKPCQCYYHLPDFFRYLRDFSCDRLA